MKFMETIKTDVLVIGGGGAGCKAALEAKRHVASVTIACKYAFGKCGATRMGAPGYSGVLGVLSVHPEDNVDAFFDDTVRAGGYLNDQNLVEVYVRNAGATILELERMGMSWDKRDGLFRLVQLQGNTIPRGAYGDQETGLRMQQTLVREVHSHGIDVYDNLNIVSLLTSDGEVVGAVGIDVKTLSTMVFQAKSVVLATGGAGNLYKISTNPGDLRGDGMAMALRAGARLVDMEMVQFLPRGRISFSQSVHQGARLFNALGERFMEKYDPVNMEMATRDIVSRAIFTEIKEGRGTERNTIFFDCSPIYERQLKEELPFLKKSLERLKRSGVDLREPLEMGVPAAHYIMGGVQINEFCETCIPGLYAAGEVEGGFHGANRLGGGAFAEIQVFGRIAGEYAAKRAAISPFKKISEEQVDEELRRFHKLIEGKGEGGVGPREIIEKLQELMTEKVGVVRNEKELREALEEIRRMSEQELPKMRVTGDPRIIAQEMIDALGASNMVLVAETIAKSALYRTESRGAHYREDHPESDDEGWLRHTVAVLEDGEVEISTAPVMVTRPKPENRYTSQR